MEKKYLAFLFFCILSLPFYAQNKKYGKEIEKANDFLNAENYNKANEIFDALLDAYPDDLYLNYKAGESFLFSEDRIDDAIRLLQLARKGYPIKKKKNEEAIEIRFYLAHAYHLNFQFHKALLAFENLRRLIPAKQKEVLVKIDREIQYCKNAVELQKYPVHFSIKNIGPIVNTIFDEHSPVINLQEDMLLFTSNRLDQDAEKMNSGIEKEKIYYSIWREGKWLEAKPVSFNEAGDNATISISPDGSALLVYQNDGADGNIYMSKKEPDGWSLLEPLPEPINTLANETHASFTLDGNTIYFSSDRQGGFGGKDIYKVSKLPDGEWGKVQNLGAGINTIYDEESPYIHPTKNKLYFSSEGHNSMGGYDIFVASQDSSGVWGNVKNVGYPVNTPFDDIFYMPTLDEQRVYYASKRRDICYGGSDIYMLEFPSNHINSLSVVSGFLYVEDNRPANGAVISLINKETMKEEGVYRPYFDSGKYLMIVPADSKYQMVIKMQGYKTIIKDFNIANGKTYARQGHALYLDPIIMEKNDEN